jgi:hypothetical protein
MKFLLVLAGLRRFSSTVTSMRRILDFQNLGRWADWFALGVPVVLPWSTSCTAVFVVLWLISLLASWNIAERFRKPWLAAGYLPALLWVVAAFGMLWASVLWPSAFHKLLAIPFFAIQFRDSPRGMWVLLAFLISSSVLLIISWGLILVPELPWRGRQRFAGDQIMIGVPVKDYNSQTTMFYALHHRAR